MGMLPSTSLAQILALEVASGLFASGLFVGIVIVDATVTTGSLMAPQTNIGTYFSYDINSWSFSENTKLYPTPTDLGA